MLADQMHVKASTGQSKEELDALLFGQGPPDATAQTRMKKILS